MASYTATQMYGSGVLGENLTSGVQKTFTFRNPGDSSYFTLETVRNSNGVYDSNSSQCASGSWVVSASMGFVYSPVIASVVVQPGTSSLTFTPASTIAGTSYNLRGTGQFNLTIA
jgi:hypothetical protein